MIFDARLDDTKELEVYSVYTGECLKGFKEDNDMIRFMIQRENSCGLCGVWIVIAEKPKAERRLLEWSRS